MIQLSSDSVIQLIDLTWGEKPWPTNRFYGLRREWAALVEEDRQWIRDWRYRRRQGRTWRSGLRHDL